MSTEMTEQIKLDNAIEILIANAVCTTGGLYCCNDCPLYKGVDPCRQFNNEDVRQAVFVINESRRTGEIIRND